MKNVEELEPLNPVRPEQEKKKWDVFEDPPTAVTTGSTVETKWIDFGEKFGKMFCYIIGFVMVLGGAVVSKGSLLFMTSQLSGQTKPYCRKHLDANKEFMVVLPLEEKALWMWMIAFSFFVPQIGTFIRSLRILLYKDWKRPTFVQFLSIFLSESCSTTGNAILVFAIFPNLDVVKGIMLTNALSFVPAILMLSSRLYDVYKSKTSERYNRTHDLTDSDVFLKLVLDVLCILIQATVFFMWPMIEGDPILWCIPAATVLISFAWWENYTYNSDKLRKKETPTERDTLARQLLKSNRKFSNSRYFVYAFISLWKCLLFFAMMICIEWIREGDVDHVLRITEVFTGHNITIQEVEPIVSGEILIKDAMSTTIDTQVESDVLIPVWVFLICVCSTYMCYTFGKFCCKVYIQSFSYAFPVNLTVPVTISGLVAICGIHNDDECSFTNTIPAYLFFDSPPMYYLNDFVGQQHSWIWLLWLLSQAWLTVHIWSSKSERLAKTERLFVRPMYEPFVIDQDLAMNRRINDEPLKESRRQEEFDRRQALLNLELDRTGRKILHVNEEDSVSRIYACGTMWHETKEEMMEFLKSVIRLDEDQCARRIIKSYLEYPLPDYYELETHVFFDDAFVRMSQDDSDPQINRYVKDLINAVDDAASKVHEINIRVRPPVRTVTPYGGRLVWTLPGRTKLIAHLKDKKKIRAKKRWSQVMYMYYLLGHKLMERDDWDEHKKTLRSNNTFILALDGDIDFQPKAVRLLVDLMKKDMNVGAACGRIHPIGSGPMVWYQMFEYAIGHWMQKATEHVIGCVLCSPGCFSLFRGSALMDASVMRRYATQSSEALHYVQFDQGEDRWLCTLLLQRGYRVEYSAASDAYTHCPEGFNEFFNQRRRWMPSTTANIFDLLLSSDKTIKINNNISRLYIGYQLFLMIGTILGPGTIFLMLVGAFVAAFQLDQWSSFLWNVVPIMFFVIVCFVFTKDTVQLFVAGILSGIYSLIMMAVLVGVILQINSDGLLAPSSLFFFCVAGEMILAAMLHPKEFNCLKYGVVYYVTVPCMYMILVIYSVFNMNNVSWGTREITVTPQTQTVPANPQPAKHDKNQNKILKLFGSKNEDSKGGIEFSLGNIFKCLLFTSPDTAVNDQFKIILAKLEALETHRTVDRREYIYDKPPSVQSLEGFEAHFVDTTVDDITENSWMDDESLQRGFVEVIPKGEVEFWEGILEKYLHPIDDSDEKKRIAADLKALRDKIVLAFFMLNSIFVLTVFLLTLKKEYINVKWPFESKANFTYLDDINEVRIYKEYLELEPIGVLFLAAFASLLAIQFVAMLIHRLKTFAQIVASTNITLFDRSVDNLTEEEVVAMNPVDYIKKLQKLKGAHDSDDEDDTLMNISPARRTTIFRLQKSAQKQQQAINDLEEAFMRRLAVVDNYKGPLPRKTVEVIAQRRKTVVESRKPIYTQQSSIMLSEGHTNRGFINDEFSSFA